MKIDTNCDLMWTYRCTTAQQILVNEVKLCTLKVQRDVQLAMAKFCWSIKDCQSQASFIVQRDVQLAMAKFCWSIKDCQSQASFINDSTMKGLGPKILAYRVFPIGGDPITTLSPPSRPCPTPQNFPENNSLPITTFSLHQGLVPHIHFQKTKGTTTAYCSKTISYC